MERRGSITELRSKALPESVPGFLGANMFGPVRGPWPDSKWKGWWGDEPPYHTPVFVLTHQPADAA